MCTEHHQQNNRCCDSRDHALHHHDSHCDCGEEMPRRFVRPLVLLLLAEGPSHGYELAQSLERFPPEGVNVEPSILYRMLKQMENEGLATSSLDDSGTGPARKVYELTPEGLEALNLWSSSLEGTAGMLRSFKERYERLGG
jgi:PadR family transcriptional regulator, regulatory protein PadR